MAVGLVLLLLLLFLVVVVTLLLLLLRLWMFLLLLLVATVVVVLDSSGGGVSHTGNESGIDSDGRNDSSGGGRLNAPLVFQCTCGPLDNNFNNKTCL